MAIGSAEVEFGQIAGLYPEVWGEAWTLYDYRVPTWCWRCEPKHLSLRTTSLWVSLPQLSLPCASTRLSVGQWWVAPVLSALAAQAITSPKRNGAESLVLEV